jgi:F420-dependent oxidoreductase-like protein
MPIMISPRYHSIGELTKRVQIAERLGVDQIWVEQQPDMRDATVAAAAYLNAAPSVSVGTAVLPVYARHPVGMAQSAATLAEVSNGRYNLGLGYSHGFINEYVLGRKPGPAIAVMREYLTIVKNLLSEGTVDVDGQHFTAHAQYVNDRPKVPIYLAALRPQMIRLAVELGDGIIVWLASRRYLAEQVMPIVRKACADFNRDESTFSVLTILPAYTGDDIDEVRANWARNAKSYRMLPYYRHVLDAFGPFDPDENSLIGTEEHVAERLAAFRDLGCVPIPSPMAETGEQFLETLTAVYGAGTHLTTGSGVA